MSDDHSPGDRRQPYADRGGPEARHAETHDVRREELTNPTGPQPEDPSFAARLAPVEAGPGGGHAAESAPAAHDKALHNRLPELTSDELARLPVLEPGTRLEQGAPMWTSTGLTKARSRPWAATKRRRATASSPSGTPITSFGTGWSETITSPRSSARDGPFRPRPRPLSRRA